VLDFATALWLAVLGACVGSFLNVVAYRVPRRMSVVWRCSHCPRCGHDIRARDNVPVLGWLLLRGRCRDCGASISPRYALVEALMGATCFTLAYVELFSGAANIFGGPLTDAVGALHTVWTPNWEVITLYAFHAALLALLLAMVLIDQDEQKIPWRLVVAALIVIAYCAFRWRFLYPERARAIRIRDIRALADMLQGVVWSAAPLVAAAAAAHARKRPDLVRLALNLAAAFALVGAGFGLRPVVRIAAMWLPGIPVVRYFRGQGRAVSYLAPLWLATLVHLLLWKPLAALVSW